MASIYPTLAIMALLPALIVAGLLTNHPNRSRVKAGLALLGLVSVAAVGVAANAAASGQWADLALTAFAILAVILDWDMALARLGDRLPRLTLWVAGYRWASSTNQRQPPR